MEWRRGIGALGAAALLAACSGGADVGQSCDSVGSADECVTNAICTDEPGGNVCAEICQEDTDCPSAYFCDSVPGSSEDTCQIRR
ncbi:MAG: hypothetical protein H6719_14525 [Sandaracinaceae bacterium]|nr:hypothetical protein [Sandaracinaceae bacterium]